MLSLLARQVEVCNRLEAFFIFEVTIRFTMVYGVWSMHFGLDSHTIIYLNGTTRFHSNYAVSKCSVLVINIGCRASAFSASSPGSCYLLQPHRVLVGDAAHLATRCSQLSLTDGARAAGLLRQPELVTQGRLRRVPAA